MRLTRWLLSCLIGCFSLIGCADKSSSESNNWGCDGDLVQCKVYIYNIEFDGEYVQNRTSLWPIALDKYNIDDIYLVIEGRFKVSSSYANLGLEEIGKKVSKSNPYVSSAYATISDIVSTNRDENVWVFNSLSEDNEVSFTLSLNLLPLIEAEKTLGFFDMGDPFKVYHDFDGENIDR